MANLTHEQIVFALSLMSNLGSGFVGSAEDLETQLAAAINTQFQAHQDDLGPWVVVWGPAIFQQHLLPSRADNAMFVAQNVSDPSEYVISIAGTNPYSPFDWVLEDVFVARQVPWEYGNPPSNLNPTLADGTHLGLSIVQQMKPGPTLPGNALPIQSFLQNLPPGNVTLTVAGHSLGGALAPVTALWLSDTQAQWDPTHRATLFCLPSAGPTPGNQDFATYYQSSPLGARTTRIHNRIDVVPHAWASTDLAQVPTLYQPNINPDTLVKTAVFLAAQASKKGNFAQINVADPELPGTVNTDPTVLMTTGGLFQDFENFTRQMSFQHVDAYLQLLGLPQFIPVLADARSSAITGLHATLPVLEKSLARRLAMLKLRGLTVPNL